MQIAMWCCCNVDQILKLITSSIEYLPENVFIQCDNISLDMSHNGEDISHQVHSSYLTHHIMFTLPNNNHHNPNGHCNQVWRTSTPRRLTSSASPRTWTSATTSWPTCPRWSVHQVQEVLINYFPISDPDEEPEGHQVPRRLLQRAARDPQEHVPQALRAGDHQL